MLKLDGDCAWELTRFTRLALVGRQELQPWDGKSSINFISFSCSLGFCGREVMLLRDEGREAGELNVVMYAPEGSSAAGAFEITEA